MKPKKDAYPPRWAERLLSWYCKPSLLEDLQGDLFEYFERNVKTKGARRARWIYVIDVFKFFRLYTVRKPEFVNLLIQWIMIGSYIKTSGRSLVRHKLFSTINIIGLSISMSVGLLMIALLTDLFSYDDFHEKGDRIYRVTCKYESVANDAKLMMSTTSMRAGKAIKETFTGLEDVAIIHNNFQGDMQFGEKIMPISGYWANESFFSVFTFPMLQGNPSSALKNPFSVVLTEKTAKKIFGDADALGKVLTLNNDKSYTVTGVMKDIPQLSHMRFDALASLSTRERIVKEDDNEMDWDNVWSTWVYVTLPDNIQKADLQANLDKLSEKENRTVENKNIALGLQPLHAIMVDKQDLNNQMGPTMGTSLIWTFSGLTFVVMLSACFNYTNLSIARSLRRTKEIGVRKVIGALRGHVVTQFVVEAVVLSLIALAVAFLIFLFLRPYFMGLEKDLQKILVLNLSLKLIVLFVGFAILVGLFAGIFPALFFSKINVIQVLRSASSLKVFRKLTMRKVLITFQYTISIILITSTLIIFKQYKYFLNFDLGFTTENVLNISLQGNKAELLKKDLAELPEVRGISQSVMITSVGNYWASSMKYMPSNPMDSGEVLYNTVDEHYLTLHDHKLLAGRNFIHKPDSAVENEVIVNEHVLKRFNIADQNPAKAIGEVVKLDGKDMTIIGVMRNFQYGKAHDRMGTQEVVLRYANADANFLNVKILSADWLATREKIEAIWKKHDTIHPLEARFYSEALEEAYSGMEASIKLAGFISFLTIGIASLGLLGMVVFTTETRLKEISIRKVLGATESRLLYILGKGFFVLLGIAAIIALPITFLFFDQVMFPEMGSHAPISMMEMLSGVVVVFAIALAMIFSQTIKVARANPAEVLKTE